MATEVPATAETESHAPAERTADGSMVRTSSTATASKAATGGRRSRIRPRAARATNVAARVAGAGNPSSITYAHVSTALAGHAARLPTTRPAITRIQAAIIPTCSPDIASRWAMPPAANRSRNRGSRSVRRPRTTASTRGALAP